MTNSVRTTLIAAVVALLSTATLIALAQPVPVAGRAEVRFVEPEHFRDAGRSPIDRERALATLAAHIEQLARRLPEGQRLRVDVLDVDLAGEPAFRRGNDVRVLRGGADWPQLRLRWSLVQGERTLKSAEVTLSDLGYLQSRIGLAAADGDLPFEKRLLTNWFRGEFEGGR
jgi:hypothetical protein